MNKTIDMKRRSTLSFSSLYLSSSDEPFVEDVKIVKPRPLDSYRFKYPEFLSIPQTYRKNDLPLPFCATPETLLNLTLKIVDRWPLPDVYGWDIEKVCRWIKNYGYPQYQNTFRGNFINGRNLLLLDASALPAMNIKDFDHIRHITYGIRCLFQFELTKFGRSISLTKEHYPELYKLMRVKNGKKYENIKPSDFWRQMQLIRPLREYRDHWDLLESCLNHKQDEILRIGAGHRNNLYKCKKTHADTPEKVNEIPCLCMPPCECNWTERHVKPPSRLKCISPRPQEPVEGVKVLSVLPSRFHERAKNAAAARRGMPSSILSVDSRKSYLT